MRFREIAPAEAAPFCDSSMLALGIFSVAVGAIFMVRQNDFKRLLAYSSVEHIGLITILYSLSAGLSDVRSMIVLALFAHIVTHSLTKTLLFQTAGNLLLAFNTRAVPVVQGLAVSMKGHALLWLVGIVFICAMPPSVLFFSELALVFSAPAWVSVVVLILLFIVFAAMMKIALSMVMGKPLVKSDRLPKRLAIVPAILLIATILLGVAGVYFVIQ